MTEPGTGAFVLTGSVLMVLGPVLGPWALIVFGAAIGSLLAMGKAPVSSRTEGAKFIAMGVAVAVVITGLAAYLVEKHTSIPTNIALMPLSFAIGATRSKLLALMEVGVEALGAALALVFNRKGPGA